MSDHTYCAIPVETSGWDKRSHHLDWSVLPPTSSTSMDCCWRFEIYRFVACTLKANYRSLYKSSCTLPLYSSNLDFAKDHCLQDLMVKIPQILAICKYTQAVANINRSDLSSSGLPMMLIVSQQAKMTSSTSFRNPTETESCFRPVSNWGPFACWSNVMTTTLRKLCCDSSPAFDAGKSTSGD